MMQELNVAAPAFLGPIGTTELVIIAVIALLIFGRRLPDVARSVGKSIVEFKKGIRDVKGDIDDQSRLEPPKTPKLDPPAEPDKATREAESVKNDSTPGE